MARSLLKLSFLREAAGGLAGWLAVPVIERNGTGGGGVDTLGAETEFLWDFKPNEKARPALEAKVGAGGSGMGCACLRTGYSSLFSGSASTSNDEGSVDVEL